MASFRCYDNSDVIATLIITNFHLYLIQLWCQFFQIFVNGDVVYAQTWEVLTLKNCIEPPYISGNEKNCHSTYEFGLPCDRMISPPHSFFHCVSVSLFEWVSCKKKKSVFCFRHHVKIILLFRKLLMPLTFNETSLHVSTPIS